MSGDSLVMGGFLAASDLVGRRVRVFQERSVKSSMEASQPVRYEGTVRAVGSAPHGLVMWIEQEVENNSWCTKGELFQAGGSDGILLLPQDTPDDRVPAASPLPCAFCGGASEMDSVLRDGYAECPDDPDARAYYRRCLSCGAHGGWAKSTGGAERYWAMRPGGRT